MEWNQMLKGDPLPWLLAHKDPGVRYLALRDLSGCPSDDPELLSACQAAYTGGPIAAILDAMDPAGFWVRPGPGYNPKYRSTVWALTLLAQLGASASQDQRIARGCSYLVEQALAPGGQFSISGVPSGTVDCLQGNLCWALVELGFEHPRLPSAFEWMARTVTAEGIAPLEDRQSELRFYAYKCGPRFACGANGGKSCAWGAVKVLLALDAWPSDLRTPLIESAIAAAVDFLFSTDPAGAAYPTRTGSKPSRDWWKFGFPLFYITDLLQNVQALVSAGYGQDPRLANALKLVLEKQDAQGRWPLEFAYDARTWGDYGQKGSPNPWVTLRALKVLKAAYPAG